MNKQNEIDQEMIETESPANDVAEVETPLDRNVRLM